MMKNVIQIIIALLLFSAASYAQEITIIGTSPVYKGDMAAAKQNALANAITYGVAQAAINQAGSELLSQNFKKFYEFLSKNPDKFISSYKILAEENFNGKYQIMAALNILPDVLKSSLDQLDLSEKKENYLPKILFLMAEQNLEDLSPKYWWKNDSEFDESAAARIMAQHLENAGFFITDNKPLKKNSEQMFGPNLNNAEALILAKEFKADMLIIGKSIIYKVTDSPDSSSFNATITARVLNTDTGEEIFSFLETAVSKQAENALNSACKQAVDKLTPKMTVVWENTLKTACVLNLLIKGTHNLGNFVQFRKALSTVPGVKDIQIQTIGSNEAMMGLCFEKGAESLSESLKTQKFEFFTLKTQIISEKKLSIDMIAKTDSSLNDAL